MLRSPSQGQTVDYDAFDRDSQFPYGYCTELLLQLLRRKEPFCEEDFKDSLRQLGDSLVVSVQEDKVRIHIHTKEPEQVFALCHRYGEFLTCKIENMTVQHADLSKRILCSDVKNEGAFALVAVAGDPGVQKLFVEMGADVAVCCEDNVSTKDYLDAFEKVTTPHIVVFPNSSDAILSAMQAKNLYKKAKITVLNSRSIAECYAALPAVDFETEDVEQLEEDISRIINNLYVVSVARRKTPVTYGNKNICANAYYSFSGKELVQIGKTLEETVLATVENVLSSRQKEIITIFYNKSVSEDQMEMIVEQIQELDFYGEVFTVPAENLHSELMVSFE